MNKHILRVVEKLIQYKTDCKPIFSNLARMYCHRKLIVKNVWNVLGRPNMTKVEGLPQNRTSTCGEGEVMGPVQVVVD